MLLKTRDARGSLSRASLRRLAGSNFLQLNVCDELPQQAQKQVDATAAIPDPSLVQRARERVVSPPLGWLLSKLARDWMDAALTGTNPKPNGSCYKRNTYMLKRVSDVLN